MSPEIFELALCAIALVTGVFTWTLLEYVIHRWLGHAVRLRPNPFAAEHIRHHSEGNYFAPTYKKAGAALVFALLVTPASVLFLGTLVGACFSGGLVLMYVAYEVLHRRDHTHPGMGRHMRALRRHHFYHHFEDPSMNHGVTTRFWDRVFGTYREPKVISVPPKLAMSWLVEPSGEVAAPFAAHYRLTRPMRASELQRAA